MNRQTAMLLLAGVLASVVIIVCFGLVRADPGAAMVRALDEARFKPFAGTSITELEHTDLRNLAQNKEWMPISIFGEDMHIPRNSKGIQVFERKTAERTRVVHIASPSFGFLRYFRSQPEKNEMQRLTILQMGPGTKEFKLLVSALHDAGESVPNARKIVADARDALVKLRSEDLFVRLLQCDRNSLAKELQLSKAAEKGFLSLVRWLAIHPDRAFRFRVGEDTVYVVHSVDLSMPDTSSWIIHAFNRKGQATWDGRYRVYLPTKLKNELDALKQILVVGEEDSEKPREETSTKPRPTTQSSKE